MTWTLCGAWGCPMSEYRDPRIDPRAGDVLRLASGDVEQVLVIDYETVGHERRAAWIDTSDILGRERAMTIAVWRDYARNAAVLWQDDAPPPADVSLLASANRALAEQVATLTAERDEARRVLLALAGEIDVNPWEYVVTSLGSVLGVKSTADAVSAALRRLCGVSDG